MKTILIDKDEYVSYGVSEDPRRIITEFCSIMMYPICDSNGVKWDKKDRASIPGDAPNIVPITFEMPDLTEEYIDDVRSEFEDFHKKWVDISDIEAARIMDLIRRKHPKETKTEYDKFTSSVLEDNAKAINGCKRRNSEMEFTEFRSTKGRKNLWIRLENGGIDRKSFSRLEQKYGYRDPIILSLKLESMDMIEGCCDDYISAIRFEAQYDDPRNTVIFLMGCQKVDHTPAERQHVLACKEDRNQEDSWETLSLSEKKACEMRVLEKKREKGNLQRDAVTCYKVYKEKGNIRLTAKKLSYGTARVTKLLEACEGILKYRVRKNPRGGRGAKKEPLFDDKEYSDEVMREDSVYSDNQAALEKFDYDEIDRRLNEE